MRKSLFAAVLTTLAACAPEMVDETEDAPTFVSGSVVADDGGAVPRDLELTITDVSEEVELARTPVGADLRFDLAVTGMSSRRVGVRLDDAPGAADRLVPTLVQTERDGEVAELDAVALTQDRAAPWVRAAADDGVDLIRDGAVLVTFVDIAGRPLAVTPTIYAFGPTPTHVYVLADDGAAIASVHTVTTEDAIPTLASGRLLIVGDAIALTVRPVGATRASNLATYRTRRALELATVVVR